MIDRPSYKERADVSTQSMKHIFEDMQHSLDRQTVLLQEVYRFLVGVNDNGFFEEDLLKITDKVSHRVNNP